ncbi:MULTISPECIES: uracil-DNA glycosylase family protein [unclassified Roseibium]|uniref:uracil-DNA glycosylase n=1 Tax=unclassified Roseibium TaxID=2629323 RepID=UPI00273F8B4B|nr:MULTISPECIES: uracil-DNA glycosylase [unclassified Roseibium]
MRHLEALLDFYLASGVDASLGEEVVDWFQLSEVQAKARQQIATPQAGAQPVAPGQGSSQQVRQMPQQHQSPSQPGPAPAAPVVGAGPRSPTDHGAIPDQAVISMAREQASSTGSLADLRACLEAFDGCNLKRTAKSLVFADGNPNARVMFIGEAPGRDEDLQGKPFVGRSGQLLDRMLKAIGLDRSQVYIANTVPWRPPGNRTPTPQETEICRPFIQRQIELVNPDVVVFLGAASAKTLLGVQDGIRKMRGRWMTYPVAGRQVAALATYHPAYLLRSPLEKRLSWRDFLSVKSKLSELG